MRKSFLLSFVLLLLVLTIFTLCSCQGENYDSDFIPNFNDTSSTTETNTDLVEDGVGDTDDSGAKPDIADSDVSSNFTYTIVSFNSDGGENIENIQIAIGEDYNFLEPTKYNNKFVGWYYDGNLIANSGKWSINQEKIELVASWETIDPEIQYINYDFNGGQVGTGNFPLGYKATDKKFQIGIPTREGNFKFIGWQDGDDIIYHYTINEGTTNDICLKAIWYELEYTYQDDKGYRYLLKEDNTLSIVGYVGEVSNIFIPSSYNGYTVTEIGPYAFCGYGDKIASIQSNGFIRCDIPDCVTKISIGAFDGCDDLKVQLSYTSEMASEDWTSTLIIEERNNHVLDVINGKRPAIGWNKYWIPGT